MFTKFSCHCKEGFVNCLGDRRDFYLLLLSLLFNIIIVIIIMIIRTNPTAAFLFRFSLEQVLNNVKFSEYQVAVVIFVVAAKFFVISTITSVSVYAAVLYPTVIRYGVSQSNKLVAFLMIIWKSMFPLSRPIRVITHSISHFSLPFWATHGTCDIDLYAVGRPMKGNTHSGIWEILLVLSGILGLDCLGLHYMERGSIITLHLAWNITNKREAGVTLLLTLPVFRDKWRE